MTPSPIQIVQKGNSWVVTPKGDGWIFSRTFPTKWKAELAVRVWHKRGRPSDYFAAARERKGERRSEHRPPLATSAPKVDDWRNQAAWMAAMTLAECRTLPGCLAILALSGKGWWTPDEIWQHLATCQACIARSAVVTKASVELATMAIPGCSWIEGQFAQASALDPTTLGDHERNCSTCRARWDLIRRAAHLVALSDWMPGCEWVRDKLADAALTVQEYERHSTSCAACQTKLQYLDA